MLRRGQTLGTEGQAMGLTAGLSVECEGEGEGGASGVLM